MRRNGYAIDDEEFQPGVICVGAAIRDHNGAVVGAISASTPTMRASDEHLTLMREEVVSAVARAVGRTRRAGFASRPSARSQARIAVSQENDRCTHRPA